MPINFSELGAKEEDIEKMAHNACYGDGRRQCLLLMGRNGLIKVIRSSTEIFYTEDVEKAFESERLNESQKTMDKNHFKMAGTAHHIPTCHNALNSVLHVIDRLGCYKRRQGRFVRY